MKLVFYNTELEDVDDYDGKVAVCELGYMRAIALRYDTTTNIKMIVVGYTKDKNYYNYTKLKTLNAGVWCNYTPTNTVPDSLVESLTIVTKAFLDNFEKHKVISVE